MQEETVRASSSLPDQIQYYLQLAQQQSQQQQQQQQPQAATTTQVQQAITQAGVQVQQPTVQVQQPVQVQQQVVSQPAQSVQQVVTQTAPVQQQTATVQLPSEYASYLVWCVFGELMFSILCTFWCLHVCVLDSTVFTSQLLWFNWLFGGLFESIFTMDIDLGIWTVLLDNGDSDDEVLRLLTRDRDTAEFELKWSKKEQGASRSSKWDSFWRVLVIH